MTFEWFFETLGDLDWLAVIVGTLAAFILSYIWYAPLFGRIWSKATGIQMNQPAASKMVQQVILLFVFNVGLNYWIFGQAEFNFENAVVMGLLFGLLLIAPAMFTGVVWAGTKRAQFYVDAGYWIAAVIVAAFVQGLFL